MIVEEGKSLSSVVYPLVSHQDPRMVSFNATVTEMALVTNKQTNMNVGKELVERRERLMKIEGYSRGRGRE